MYILLYTTVSIYVYTTKVPIRQCNCNGRSRDHLFIHSPSCILHSDLPSTYCCTVLVLIALLGHTPGTPPAAQDAHSSSHHTHRGGGGDKPDSEQEDRRYFYEYLLCFSRL